MPTCGAALVDLNATGRREGEGKGRGRGGGVRTARAMPGAKGGPAETNSSSRNLVECIHPCRETIGATAATTSWPPPEHAYVLVGRNLEIHLRGIYTHCRRDALGPNAARGIHPLHFFYPFSLPCLPNQESPTYRRHDIPATGAVAP